MKIKTDFVTNSSSTAFIIHNKTNKRLSIVDFVKENPHLIEKFISQYTWYSENEGYTQEGLIKSAEDNIVYLNPGDNYIVFGDEDGTIIGNVFDYILRGGGSSKSFKWRFSDFHR